jgi:hypothetical protein
MQEPESTDITQYAGYTKLSGDQQKKVAETYTNVYNNNQAKLGFRVAQGIAFETAKKMCEGFEAGFRATRDASPGTIADDVVDTKISKPGPTYEGDAEDFQAGNDSLVGMTEKKDPITGMPTYDLEKTAMMKKIIGSSVPKPSKKKAVKEDDDEKSSASSAMDTAASAVNLAGALAETDDAGLISGDNPEEDGAARILRMNHDKMCVGCGAIHPLDVMCFNGRTHSEAGAGGGNGASDILKQNHAQKGMKVEDSDPEIAAAARYLTNRAKVSGLMESLEEGAGDIQKKNVENKCPDCGAMHGPKEKCNGQSEPDTDKDTEKEVDDADKILKKNHKDKGLDERKIFGIGPSKGKPSPKVGAALKKYVAGQAKPPVVKEDEIDEKHIGFKALQGKLERSGKSAESAGAIAASIGKKKYGAATMKKGAASHTPLGEDVELNEEIEQMWAENFYPAKPLEESCGNCSHPKSYHSKACQTCNECAGFVKEADVEESEHKKNQICYCGHEFGHHGNGGCKSCKHEGVVAPSKAAHQFRKNDYKERFEDEYSTIFAAQQGKIHTTMANAALNWLPEELELTEGKGYEDIGPGDHVKFNHPLRGSDKVAQQGKGRVVMKGPAGWVLNTGGKHGTPAIVSADNYVSHRKAKKKMTEDEMIDSMVEDAYDDHRAVYNVDDEANKKKEAARKKKNQARRDRDSVMRDMGLNKVKGSVSGKTYWEAEEEPKDDEKYAPGPTYEADTTHGGNHKAGQYKPDNCPSCATTDKRSEKDKTDLKGLVKEKESDPYAKFRDPKIDYYSERHPNSTMLTDRAQRANHDMINRLAGHLAKERNNPKAKTEETDPLMAAALGYINHEVERAGGPTDLEEWKKGRNQFADSGMEERGW